MRSKSLLAAGAFALVCSLFPAAAVENAAPVTEETARQTALSQLDGARVIRSKTRTRHDGRIRHTYLIINDKDRAEVVVDGADGGIVKLEIKPINTGDSGGRINANWTTRLSADDAKEIALQRTGGGEVVKIEKDYDDDGPTVYEIDIIKDNVKYEVEVDADTGAIHEFKAKSINKNRKAG